MTSSVRCQSRPFTAIPGEGDRAPSPGAQVRFEVVDGPLGRTAWTVRAVHPLT
ncbi:hypothetical protein DAETH_38390 (plasmid) [Deinococcus aetherius]|uniref:Uncharacterized protein n=1 Tax=Deinococcus aetherius TaxID=200252 RepID=A0ABM8AJJ6_9DEIO|nr:hypothetical protein [Deinococcus aetherius]BDP43870.1 hypothetical protein DAETH_38390 [Deinococcus aetherius]